ncbi:MAG: prepilin peptidase [Parcubacteria group bacterium]|jgi:prepilin signal peptidase PulO-like enzyme (type II secretory pathway)
MVLIFFITGLIIGSFLGAANYRLKTAEDIVFKRSHCPLCKHDIRWYDNIPLLSFIVLHGRCRDCRKYISREYPLIELMTGLLFAGVAVKFFGAPLLGISGMISGTIGTSVIVDMSFLLFAVCYLVIIFWHDYDFMLIPDAVAYPAIVVTFFYQIYKYVQSPLSIANFHSPLTGAVISALGAALFFFFLIWISKGKWIGGGDVKLGFLAGLIVGWPKILFVFFFTYLIGSVVSLVLIVLKKKTWKSQIPFGPFMVAAILLVLFFSDQIQFWANRYLNIGY